MSKCREMAESKRRLEEVKTAYGHVHRRSRASLAPSQRTWPAHASIRANGAQQAFAPLYPCPRLDPACVFTGGSMAEIACAVQSSKMAWNPYSPIPSAASSWIRGSALPPRSCRQSSQEYACNSSLKNLHASKMKSIPWYFKRMTS